MIEINNADQLRRLIINIIKEEYWTNHGLANRVGISPLTLKSFITQERKLASNTYQRLIDFVEKHLKDQREKKENIDTEKSDH